MTRPNPHQITDSRYEVRPSRTQWVVVETYDTRRRMGERDTETEELAWFDTREEAEADRDRRAAK